MIENIIIIVFSIIGAIYIFHKIGEYADFKTKSEYFKDQYKFGKNKSDKEL